MNSFKQYFYYRRHHKGCGINNIYFGGTREDWEKLQHKLLNIKRYDVDGVLKKYVEHVSVILRKFLDTFDGNPDDIWWNGIMNTEEVRRSSGSTK